VQQTLKLGNSQDYAVSAFAPSPFFDQSPTFVYAAAVREHERGPARVLGGIGVVWDAASQLASILADCGDGFSAQDLLAFVDANGRLVASHGAVALLPTPQTVTQCRSGERIVALGNALYGVGADRGQGYREYRTSDGYDHGLSCVVLRNLCPTRSVTTGPQLYRPSAQNRRQDVAQGVHMATFTVAGHWLGLPAAQVVQAAPDVTILSGGTSCPPFLGITQVGIKAHPVIDLRNVITCHADGKSALVPGKLAKDDTRQLILVRVPGADGRNHELALRVDTLGAVLEVDSRKMQDLGGQYGDSSSGAGLVDAVVPVLTMANGPSSSQALLSRVSQRWLQLCAGGLQQDFLP
jgi:chemotaxis signal transduction protein